MMFRFAYPALLALLVVIAGWLLFALWRKPTSVTYSTTSTIAELAGSARHLWDKIPLILRTGCLVLLVMTAARPQLYNVPWDVLSPGVDIVLCLDTSGSMEALDFQLDGNPVSRLTAVKKVVGEFIEKREMDRIGLVVFGEEAFTQSPLTMDKGLLLGLVNKMQIGMAGDRTAIGSAIAIGGKRLKDLKAKSRILILLTDGRHNAGDLTPEVAAEAVKALDIKIYTIGVGGTWPGTYKVNEEMLEKIARIGGGKYFRAADTERLSEIYDIIDREEKTEVKVEEFFHFRELYGYFLVPALILLGVEVFLRGVFLRVIP
ncbi:MAG: VWA domain-containing protein [Deltaproteobacteria bacterium]|nr:MAG: VWA domain-containing protein [Deltaproteobacteria bacterium]